MISIAELSIAWTVARRDLRGGLKSFLVMLACLALGVAAIAAVGLVNASVVDTIRRDARMLLGGDFALENPNVPIDSDVIAALVPDDAEVMAAVRTNAMLGSADGRHVVVALKAVDDRYPLLGSVELDPPQRIGDALADRGAVVEAPLLARLGVQVGDRVQLGDAEVRIAGVLLREPDRLGGAVSFGPRVMVSLETLQASGILRPGALARYDYRVLLPAGLDAAAVATRLKQLHPDSSWRVRTSSEVQPQIARFTDRLASYLTLAALSALLVGGLGVALSVTAYLASRTEAIATMKSLGGTSRQITTVYLLEIMALATLGTLLGLALGALLPFVIHSAAGHLLPIEVRPGLHAGPLLLAAGCGLLTALAFGLWPLGRAREIGAAALFRATFAPPHRRPRASFLIAIAAALLGLVGLTVLAMDRPSLALIAAGVAVVAALLLTTLAQALLRLLASLGRSGPVALRLGASNLVRPGSGAPSVLVALGAGLAVLTAITLLQATLSREIQQRLPARAPSYVLIDIQPDQKSAFEALVADTPDAALLQIAPSLRARIVRIGGQPVHEVAIAEHVRWTVNRDRGLSYQREMPAGTELTAGAWWPADYSGPSLVSVEDEVALGYGVGVGDTLHFNILGRVVEARIANLRRDIDWSTGRLDFVFVLSPGVIENAPHTLIAAVRVPPPAAAGFIDRLATKLPNVTPIGVGDIIAQVSDVMERIGLAVRVVAAVSLATGALVLAGAVLAARRRHLHQTVILKVLGARRREVLQMLLVEYAALGLAAAVIGVLIGTLGAWAAVTFVLDLGWQIAPLPVAITVMVALLLTLAVSGTGVWRLLGQPVAAVLRTP